MTHFNDKNISARNYFPRGLVQPEASFRFSADALLLGGFATACRPQWRNLADLGCGCGVVAFSAMLLVKGQDVAARRAVGVDAQPELLAAATQNAELLGFTRQFTPVLEDLRLSCAARVLPPGLSRGGFDLITANPPYRLSGHGREPASPLRRMALFGGHDTLLAFASSARMLLAKDGLFCLVFAFDRYMALCAALAECGFMPERLLPVATGRGETPLLALLAVRKGEAEHAYDVRPVDLALYRELEDPLHLYVWEGGTKKVTEEAMALCPYLR